MSNDFTNAARDGNLVAVQQFLADGVDPNTTNENGGFAIILAAENGHTAVVSRLISARAELDVGGKTALMCAATRGYGEIVDLLLSSGASVDATDQNGQSALIWATAYRHADVVRCLLAHRANKTITDNFGNTALSVAHDTQNEELQLLLRD